MESHKILSAPFAWEKAEGGVEYRVHPSQTIEVKTTEKATALVVFCHGLGDSAHGWASVCVELSRSLPWVHWVLPSAPARPVTLNGGMSMPAWYDLTGLSDRANESCEGIDDASMTLQNIIFEHPDLFPLNRVVLAGFSQGAGLSIYTTLKLLQDSSSPATLAGTLMMSGYMPCPSQFTPESFASKTKGPVCILHGDADPMVVPENAVKTQAKLKELGLEASLKWYKGLTHSSNDEEVADACAFLKKVLPRL